MKINLVVFSIFYYLLNISFGYTQSVGISDVVFTPQSLLHVYSTSATTNLFQLGNSTSPASGFQISMTSGINFDIINRESGYLTFHTFNTERIRMTNNGLVGIGTTTPQRKLDVRGDAVVYSSGEGYSEGFNVFRSGAEYWSGYNLHVAVAGTGAVDAEADQAGGGDALLQQVELLRREVHHVAHADNVLSDSHCPHHRHRMMFAHDLSGLHQFFYWNSGNLGCSFGRVLLDGGFEFIKAFCTLGNEILLCPSILQENMH